MNISMMPGMLTAAYWADDTVLMVGLHGIGKTDVVRQWANKNNFHLEVLYLANQEVGDLIGLPKTLDYNVPDGVDEDGEPKFRTESLTIWTKPIWLQKLDEAAKTQPTVLFLDELSRAPLDVRQAALQLILDREIHQHQLPTHEGMRTLIVAADNPDNGDYNVETLDPALLDRFLSVNVEVDVSSWLQWARENKVNKMVTGFIAENNSKLHWMPDEGAMTPEGTPDNVGATPRSWTKLAKFIDNLENTPRELHYQIMKGKVGSALASQFNIYLRDYNDSVSIKDIETLVEEVQKKTSNIEKLGLAVEELIDQTEAIQKTELAHSMIEKYIDLPDEECIPMMALLYALPIETINGLLKALKTDNREQYSKIANIDKALNKKGLFLKIVSKIA